MICIGVNLDIKPGGGAATVNLKSKGVLPAAILGSDSFDVSEINVSTLAFGPNGAPPAHKQGGHSAELNNDAFADLLSHYRVQETGLMAGDTEACISGELIGGQPFGGCDSIQIVPK